MSVHGLGLTEHVHGTDTVKALINLALLTGNIGRPGTGVNPLRGQNNVQGAAHMGCYLRNLTGMVAIDEGRPMFERVWGAPVPHGRGLDLMEMMDAARGGRLAALWAVGYDVYLTNPDEQRTRAALESLELLVVQDSVPQRDRSRVRPRLSAGGCSVFEKDGTFMNGERRVQRVRRAVAPPPGVQTDWEIMCAVARAMGREAGFAFASAQHLWDEIRTVWPAGAGISYPRLEAGGLQRPCPREDHPGTEDPAPAGLCARGPGAAALGGARGVAGSPLGRISVPPRHRAGSLPVQRRHHDRADSEHRAPPARRAGDGAAGRRAAGLAGWRPGPRREPDRRVDLPVQMREDLRQGEVFTTFHSAASFVNRVTGDGLDPITHTPEYKRTAVRISRASL